MSRNQEDVFLNAAKIAHLIRWFGDPILRTRCLEVPIDEINGPQTQALAQKLINTLKQVRELIGLGRGLAAPQIGVPKRMIVIYNAEYKVLINPKIIHVSDEVGIYPEMCLSGLPMAADVVRPWEAEIEYRDIGGISHRWSADPLLSRLLQHEVDHLDGILFIDQAQLQTVRFVSDFEEYKATVNLVQV